MARKKTESAAKIRRREQMLNYLSNPDNPWPKTRSELFRDILGYKNDTSIYTVFTLEELAQIEWDALARRRGRYAPKISRVDDGIIEAGAAGSPAAGKLAYQRFEGWVEKTGVELDVKPLIIFGGGWDGDDEAGSGDA